MAWAILRRNQGSSPLIPLGAPYSAALAALLREAAQTGLVMDFTRDIAFRQLQKSTITGVSGWSYTRSGTAYDLAGTTSFGANVARRTSAGLLVEAGATNLLLQSQTFDNASWAKTRSSISADNAIAPDGTSTADTLTDDASNNTHYTQQNLSPGVNTYTYSVFAKASTLSAVWLFAGGAGVGKLFNLSNGTLGSDVVGAPTSSSITALANGWYRCSITFTGTPTDFWVGISNSTTAFSYAGTGAGTILVWGAQLETGSSATSYIPTTSSSASRGADAASVTFSQALPYSVIAEFLVPNPVTGARIVGQNSLSETPLQISLATAVSNFNGTGSIQSSISTSMSGRIVRAGSAHSTGDAAITLDGLSPTTGTPNNAALTLMAIGSLNGSSNFLGGNLRLLAILPRRITNTELQNATA